jgi:hypothetical protein
MAKALSVAELFKYSWRVEKFISKYESREPFMMMNNSKSTLAFEEETLSILRSKKEDQYRKLIFRDAKIKSKTYRLTSFMKTEEFGGRPNAPATGTDFEVTAANNINEQISEILSKTGKKSIKVSIASNEYTVTKAAKLGGNAKADLAMLDDSGNEVAWISYKKGTRATDFQQWSGLTEGSISSHPEVQMFIQQVQQMFKDTMPSATTVAKMIKDPKLKKYAIYGADFKIANRNLGRQNVSLVAQGDIKLKKNGTTFEFISERTYDNGETITSDYEPVLMVIYKGDRGQFGIKGARFGIQPRSARYITQWLE